MGSNPFQFISEEEEESRMMYLSSINTGHLNYCHDDNNKCIHSIAPNPEYDTRVRLKEMKDYKNAHPNLIMYYISHTMPRSFYFRCVDLSTIFDKTTTTTTTTTTKQKRIRSLHLIFQPLPVFCCCCFCFCFSVLFCTLIKGITPQIGLLCFGILDKRSF